MVRNQARNQARNKARDMVNEEALWAITLFPPTKSHEWVRLARILFDRMEPEAPRTQNTSIGHITTWESVLAVVGFGDVGFLKDLLRKLGRDLPTAAGTRSDRLIELVQTAAGSGEQEMYNFVSGQLIVPLDEYTFLYAATSGNLSLTGSIYRELNPGSETIAFVLRNAIKDGQLEVVKFLLTAIDVMSVNQILLRRSLTYTTAEILTLFRNLGVPIAIRPLHPSVSISFLRYALSIGVGLTWRDIIDLIGAPAEVLLLALRSAQVPISNFFRRNEPSQAIIDKLHGPGGADADTWYGLATFYSIHTIPVEYLPGVANSIHQSKINYIQFFVDAVSSIPASNDLDVIARDIILDRGTPPRIKEFLLRSPKISDDQLGITLQKALVARDYNTASLMLHILPITQNAKDALLNLRKQSQTPLSDEIIDLLYYHGARDPR